MSVDDSTQVGCEVMSSQREEEEYKWMTNETVFYLQENPDCWLAVGGEWHGTARGGVVGSVDIYFRHILTGRRCESVWDAVDGYACFDDRWADDFEKLAMHIEEISDIEKTVRSERSVMLCEKAGVGVSPTPKNEKYEKAMCKECKKMDDKCFKFPYPSFYQPLKIYNL